MKTLNYIWICFFSFIALLSPAQEFIGSSVRFSKDIVNDSVTNRKTAEVIGLIRMNDQNDEFSFQTALFPILSSPHNNDSIISLNKKIFLTFRADFPASDLDFLSNDGTERSFTLPGELTINGRTLPVNMIMSIHSAMAQTDQARGIKSYPAFISFVMEVSPADYGLDFETINFVRSIDVEVRNGVINRSDQPAIVR